MKQQAVVVVAGLTLLAAVWFSVGASSRVRISNEEEISARIDPARFHMLFNPPYGDASEEYRADHAATIRRVNADHEFRCQYVDGFMLKELAHDFPLRAGMSLSELDAAVTANQQVAESPELKGLRSVYNLILQERRVENGSGEIFYWVNFRNLFFCDVFIAADTVESVWIMPGNREAFTGIYYRLSGKGRYRKTRDHFE